MRLVDPDPLRFVQSQLHELWKEALQALQSQGQARPGTKPASHRPVPIGPYRLIVIPSIRGRAAGQIAIQGMANKQIELTTPTLRTRGLRFQGPSGNLALPRQQPRHRPPRFHELRALRPLARPKKPPA